MLPTAGLFLPETLHRNDRLTSSHTDTESTRLKHFQRRSGQAKHEAREAGSSSPATSIRSSTKNIDNFSSITTALQFADFVFASSKASSDSHTLALLIRRVQQDVSEASRLCLSPAVTNFLEAWPDKKSWIDAILVDVRRSLNDVGSYMGSFRVMGDDGGATGLKRRFEWIAAHQKRLVARQQLLSTCHQSLVTTINIMQTVELCGVTNGTWQDPIYEAPVVQPWVKSDPESVLRGPYSRREYRMSQKNLSISSMHLPQTEQGSLETRSVNSILAELPGSTPDDLAYSSNTNASTPARLQSNFRRSSHHGTYFGRARDDSKLGMTNNTSPNMRPTIPELDQTYLNHVLEHTTTRRSFDQSMLTAPSTKNNQTRTSDDCQRLSLDNGRPTINAQIVSRESASTNESLTKPGLIQALPILKENTIERNDSTMSTTAIVTVPQIAKRYHANPIYIRKHPDRHRSLPTELPHVQSQSSLTEDLADWMMLPGVQSERTPSQEWDAESVVASSPMSVVSCPAMTGVAIQPNHLPFRQGGGIAEDSTVPAMKSTTGHGISNIGQAKTLVTQETKNPVFLEPQHHIVANRERAPFVRSMSSTITRKPLPSTAKVSQEVLVATAENSIETDRTELTLNPSIAASTPDTELSLLQEQIVRQRYATNNEAESRQDETSKDTVSWESIASEAESQQNATPENMVSQEYLGNNEAESRHKAILDAGTVVQAALPSMSAVPDVEDKISIPTPPPITPKPMSAQAKRRAAHQRRMEIAFGSS